MVPHEDMKEGRRGPMVYLRLEISCNRENCHNTMCGEGKDPSENETRSQTSSYHLTG